jgi:hypothetical protein
VYSNDYVDEEGVIVIFEDAGEIGVQKEELGIRTSSLWLFLRGVDQSIETGLSRAGGLTSMDDVDVASQKLKIVLLLVVLLLM